MCVGPWRWGLHGFLVGLLGMELLGFFYVGMKLWRNTVNYDVDGQ